ncbi:hypothetical protein TTHERM_000391269 (macronuclear) [Tetrahymena thermophila SB210]|uniref:Uncharacterized protein n=1 Tax=Tetrahymena thermophila (strain SB210) TaxID=312017 RepID=W7XL16_TETTS|nr:hypothetical protein TTHERM_000391269 [Tetrahymena thermophila SB210]EWS75504.1 hypothetical protein TTHERM_000391269 [Tetrahymena thermophila SB210]|eukprot:XP_012651973.1 hypothetical protein TTHERM_000391269 [Tetrahymena thermophila SB210]
MLRIHIINILKMQIQTILNNIEKIQSQNLKDQESIFQEVQCILFKNKKILVQFPQNKRYSYFLILLNNQQRNLIVYMISSIIKNINIMKSFQLIHSAFRLQRLQYKTNQIANFQLIKKVRQIILLIKKKKEIKEILANIRRFVNFSNYRKKTFYILQ